MAQSEAPAQKTAKSGGFRRDEIGAMVADPAPEQTDAAPDAEAYKAGAERLDQFMGAATRG